MKLNKINAMTLMVLFLSSSIALAGDFDWMRGVNLQAGADPSGFRARLEARFHVGGMTIDTAIGHTDSPADAYALLRLGEISRQPMDRVVDAYRSGKGRGWGNIAKALGIKPGSSEFHALKQGQDLYDGRAADTGRGKGKGKGKKKK